MEEKHQTPQIDHAVDADAYTTNKKLNDEEIELGPTKHEMETTNKAAPKGDTAKKLSAENLQELRQQVEKKLKDFDPDKDETSKFKTKEQVTFGEIIARMASGFDKCLLFTGVLVCIIMGAITPFFMWLFGR